MLKFFPEINNGPTIIELGTEVDNNQRWTLSQQGHVKSFPRAALQLLFTDSINRFGCIDVLCSNNVLMFTDGPAKVYKCSVRKCKMTFSSQAQRDEHETSHHSATRFYIGHSLKCPICSKVFPNRSALLCHKNIHLSIKPYLCKTCGRGFSQKPNLERHEKCTHSDERPFTCGQCGKGFSDKYSFKQHEAVHASANRFQCETCGKLFKGSQNLRHHEQLHKSEKRHKCEVCGKSFYQSSALKRHIRIHTGDKPYECSVCRRGFSDGSSLKNHMYTHTEQKPYSCRVCGKTFIKQYRFKRHENSHFPDGVSDLPPLPKADDVQTAIPQVPVWNTQKETFANGATFIEETYVPVTQTRDLPPRLDDPIEVTVSERLAFPTIDISMNLVNSAVPNMVPNPHQLTVVSQYEPQPTQALQQAYITSITPKPSDNTQQVVLHGLPSDVACTSKPSDAPQVLLQGNFSQPDVISPNIVFSIYPQQPNTEQTVQNETETSSELAVSQNVTSESFINSTSVPTDPTQSSTVEVETENQSRETESMSQHIESYINEYKQESQEDNIEQEDAGLLLWLVKHLIMLWMYLKVIPR